MALSTAKGRNFVNSGTGHMNGAIYTFAVRNKVWAEVWATSQPTSRSTNK